MIQEYQKLAKPPLDFELKGCTWDTVLDQMDRATGEYHERGQNAARSAFRKLGDVAVIISPVLERIPDENGLSVLHGGLAIMFSVSVARDLDSVEQTC